MHKITTLSSYLNTLNILQYVLRTLEDRQYVRSINNSSNNDKIDGRLRSWVDVSVGSAEILKYLK